MNTVVIQSAIIGMIIGSYRYHCAPIDTTATNNDALTIFNDNNTNNNSGEVDDETNWHAIRRHSALGAVCESIENKHEQIRIAIGRHRFGINLSLII